ncbi:4-(cytidine 5'-diphospho)-2-C-methyl-D-erythritol kinase [Nitratireductor sp. GCM10026969]|uniref:4-(cytidine 5'-diphospho)-2-C-methyl-D-erythritol kinase n=1 Tax=Nitratireductor sp. GCM10026969 TaxID=3252645 RepID=UPI00360C0279
MAGGLERAAPAKINLALHVTGRRADGYHLLETLVAFTRHGDLLKAETSDHDAFVVTGRYGAEVPGDGTNLVLAARDMLRGAFGATAARPVKLTLEKNLPVASGIGGGSSDAAAAIGLLKQYWRIDTTGEKLAQIALRLGADVPMCLVARPLVARGIGETLEPVAGLPSLPALLVNPGIPLATPAVFAALVKRSNSPLPPFRGGDIAATVDWLETTRNDLEPAAIGLVPEIASVLETLRETGALLARMSGSGATCFGIFATDEDARAAAKAIASRRPAWFLQATSIMPTSEPVQDG